MPSIQAAKIVGAMFIWNSNFEILHRKLAMTSDCENSPDVCAHGPVAIGNAFVQSHQ